MHGSFFSYFGPEAASFLVKTFYCDMKHVIRDIAQLMRHPVDQQTAESYMMVCETTNY